MNAKQIIQLIYKAFGLPAKFLEFTIDSTGRINDNLYWKDLHLETVCHKKNSIHFDRHNILGILFISQVKKELPLRTENEKNDLYNVYDAMKNMISTTIERENALVCWSQISRFLIDFQKKCTHPIFMIASSRISAMLLKEFLGYPNFDSNSSVLDIMLNCWQCASVIAVHTKERFFCKKFDREISAECCWTIHEFYDLIGTNKIFVSDAFYTKTAKILDCATKYICSTTVKYLQAINSAFTYPSPEAGNVFKYCTQDSMLKTWIYFAIHRRLVSERRLSRQLRPLTLDILHKILK